MPTRPAPRPRRADAPTDDILETYFAEIGAIPRLSAEEEHALGVRALAGDEDAQQRLVTHNLRFVVRVAKTYQNTGVPLTELISEGNLGALKAAKKFDPTRGMKFVSYAAWYIRNAIRHAIAKTHGAVSTPTPSRGDGMVIAHTVSFDAPINRAGTGGVYGARGTIGDLMADEQAESPLAAAGAALASDVIGAAIAALPPRDALIMRRLFGLDGEPPETMEAVGASLGVSRERIRQIKERSLTRLAAGARGATLRTLHEGGELEDVA